MNIAAEDAEVSEEVATHGTSVHLPQILPHELGVQCGHIGTILDGSHASIKVPVTRVAVGRLGEAGLGGYGGIHSTIEVQAGRFFQSPS